jgi:hypothetical protein
MKTFLMWFIAKFIPFLYLWKTCYALSSFVKPNGDVTKCQPINTPIPILYDENRREFLSLVSIPFIAATSDLAVNIPSASAADDDSDLTKKMFNADGSLKQETDTEAKFRPVELTWDVSDSSYSAVDGVNSADTTKGSSVVLSYLLPEKWGNGKDLYVDKSEGVTTKSCNKITVYQAPGKATADRLEKASRVGVFQSLGLTNDFIDLKKADLLSGRTSVKEGQKYFEFEMAVAPAVCDASGDNLGLGFCPYESIYLLSSTVLNDHLYVLIEECSKAQWKRSNAELRRIRSSFQVA